MFMIEKLAVWAVEDRLGEIGAFFAYLAHLGVTQSISKHKFLKKKPEY